MFFFSVTGAIQIPDDDDDDDDSLDAPYGNQPRVRRSKKPGERRLKTSWTGLTLEEALGAAADPDHWRRRLRGAANGRTEDGTADRHEFILGSQSRTFC